MRENFDRLIDEAANRDGFIISVGGVPKAKVLPLEKEKIERLIQSGK